MVPAYGHITGPSLSLSPHHSPPLPLNVSTSIKQSHIQKLIDNENISFSFILKMYPSRSWESSLFNVYLVMSHLVFWNTMLVVTHLLEHHFEGTGGESADKYVARASRRLVQSWLNQEGLAEFTYEKIIRHMPRSLHIWIKCMTPGFGHDLILSQ